MIANASLPPNLMLFPPHIENMAKAMVVASTLVARQRYRHLVWLAYVDEKQKRVMNSTIKINSIMVNLKHCDWIYVDWFSCYAFL